MASNISKLWNKAKSVVGKTTDYAKEHPVKSAIITAYTTPFLGAAGTANWVAGQLKGSSSSNSKGATSYNNVDKLLDDYDEGSLYKYYGGGSGSGGGGGYNVAKADISGLLDAYDKQAESAKQAAETKYANTRSDLLTSLKRFQEQNARDVQNQKQDYLSQQANLEMAREQANRQNRISASARGLGGSGLQQLAQLQNLLGQGEEISKAAGANQSAMDKLATLLREYQEDSDTKLKQNEEERANTLSSIASALANQRATAIANNEQAYTNALNQARAQAAAARASASSNNAAARQQAANAAGALKILQNSLSSELKDLNGMSTKQLKTYMQNNYNLTSKQTKNMSVTDMKNYINRSYQSQLAELQAAYGFGTGTVNTAQNNINRILNNFYYNPLKKVGDTSIYSPNPTNTSYSSYKLPKIYK